MIKRFLVIGVFFLLIVSSIGSLSFGNKLSEKKNSIDNNNSFQPLDGPMDSAWPMFRHDLYHSGYSTSTGPNTNSKLWEYTTGDYVGSSPAVADGRVYVGSFDHKVYCLDAFNGTKIWDYTTDRTVWSSPAVADGRVYVGSYDYKVYCLNATNGSKIWDYTTGYPVDSSPAVADSKVYVGSGDYKMYCLDAANGSKIWEYTTGYYVGSSPAVADGRVYIGSADNKVYCLDAANGSKIWDYTTGSEVFSSPAVADGKVYVCSVIDKVYCLDAANGSKIWDYIPDHGVYSSPAVADGKVYIGSDDGKVYCFDGENQSPSAPIVDGPNNGLPFLTYTFTFTSTDPDGDDVSYYIDWGDGYITNWTSYQPSSSPDYSKGHFWIGFDKFTIRAKAKDNFGSESPWTNYSFSTPRNRVSYSSFFMRFLELFPNAFPILRYFVRGR